MVFKNLCILVVWAKVVSALEGSVLNRTGEYYAIPQVNKKLYLVKVGDMLVTF